MAMTVLRVAERERSLGDGQRIMTGHSINFEWMEDIHLEREISTRHTISKATVKGAVSSVFTIANDFDT